MEIKAGIRKTYFKIDYLNVQLRVTVLSAMGLNKRSFRVLLNRLIEININKAKGNDRWVGNKSIPPDLVEAIGRQLELILTRRTLAWKK